MNHKELLQKYPQLGFIPESVIRVIVSSKLIVHISETDEIQFKSNMDQLSGIIVEPYIVYLYEVEYCKINTWVVEKMTLGELRKYTTGIKLEKLPKENEVSTFKENDDGYYDECDGRYDIRKITIYGLPNEVRYRVKIH